MLSQHGQDSRSSFRVGAAIPAHGRVQQGDPYLDHLLVATSALNRPFGQRRFSLLYLGHVRHETLIDTALQEE